MRPRIDVPAGTSSSFGAWSVTHDHRLLDHALDRDDVEDPVFLLLGHKQTLLHTTEASLTAGHLQRLRGAVRGGTLAVDARAAGAAAAPSGAVHDISGRPCTRVLGLVASDV